MNKETIILIITATNVESESVIEVFKARTESSPNLN